MVSTIASLIRDNGNAILALSTATKPDGGKFLHKDILLALGLPTSTAHVREVSKFLNKQGIRRRAYSARVKPEPDGGLLPDVELDPTDEVFTQQELAAVRDKVSAAYDYMLKAERILVELGAMLRLTPPKAAQEGGEA